MPTPPPTAQSAHPRRIRDLPGRLRAEVKGLRSNPQLARRAERDLGGLPGVRHVEANPMTGRVLILYEAGLTDVPALLAEVTKLESSRAPRERTPGRVRVSPVPAPSEALPRQRARGSAFLLAEALQPLVAAALFVGIAIKVLLVGPHPRAQSERLNALSVMIGTLGGYPQVRRAARRVLGRDFPIGLLAGYLSIGIKALRESLLGLTADTASHLFEYLEMSALRRTRRQLRRLLHLHGRARLILAQGREIEIPVTELQPGELIRIEAGERIPADGVVEDGTGLVDEGVLTHRAFLSRKSEGSPVYLGTQLRQGTLYVRLTAVGADTYVGELLRRVPAQREGRLPLGPTRGARRAGAGGLALAAVMWVFARSWRRALAVLAVVNPNSFIASAVAASGAAVEAVARERVRVQRRDAFDILARVDVVLFGKTGTLTAESPAVDALVPVPGVRGARVLAIAASAARFSGHPLAIPVLEKALELGVGLLPAADAQMSARGLEARVGESTVLIGSAKHLRDLGIAVETALEDEARLEAEGSEVLGVVQDDRLIGLIGLRERLLPGAREAVMGLREAGVKDLGVLSGDATQSAARLAAELGIQRTWLGVADHEKQAIVQQLQREGHVVAVVGASAGDLPAMAQANVAIGVAGAGWTPAPRAAHIMVLHGRLDVLPGLVRLSRRLQDVYRQNFAIATVVSTVGATAAVAGLLPFGVADEFNQILTLALLFNSRRLSVFPIGGSRTEDVGRAEVPPWHALPPQEVARFMATDSDSGLSSGEAGRRLRRVGVNALAESAPPTFGTLYVKQLATGMTLFLGGAAVVSLTISEPLSAVLIAGVVLVNAGLGAFQELRAEQAVTALRSYTAPMAHCRRDGDLQEIPATQLVPGDVVMLRAGDTVPADGRLIESYELEIEEAVLTGESQPVQKSVTPVPVNADLGDRTSMVYMGCAVADGRARAIVVATGMHTEIGRIAGLLTHEEAATPLQMRMSEISRGLAGGAMVAGMAFVGAGLVRRLPLGTLALGGITLVTAAVPEGLPATITIALSAAVQRMSRRSLIVRRLSAVETLGRVTVVCCDKTGTLTQNKMAVRALAAGRLEWAGEEPHWTTLDQDARQVLKIGALCNDAVLVDAEGRTTMGSSTEGALLLAATDAGLDPAGLWYAHPRETELPFSTERGFMAVVVRDPETGPVLMLKGAPEIVAEFCDRRLVDGAVSPLDAAGKKQALDVSDRMAYEALRVLAMAYRPLDGVPSPESLEHPRECIFAGLVGLGDPLRPEVRDAVERCRRYGVRVVMATGDHRSTAIAIARQLGLVFAREGVLDGAQLEAITEQELTAVIPRTQVFARVTPEQKVRIVDAMRAAGEVVAMTGDGVNDAPAVKRADVGIAMGHTGSEVTRQASSIVLGDDSFEAIVRAIEEGRSVQRNARRSVGFLLGGNLGETLFMLGATLLAGEMPLLPIHVLLVNLFTDALPVMALAALPSSPGQAADGRVGGEIFDRSFYRAVLRRGLVTGSAATAISALAWPAQPATRRSVNLAGLVASQLVQAHGWGAGGQGDRFFQGSLWISWAALASVLMLPPLQRLFGTTALSPLAWAQILGISIATDRFLLSPATLPGMSSRPKLLS
jgi:P-type Ca2+ transporter type 2C